MDRVILKKLNRSESWIGFCCMTVPYGGSNANVLIQELCRSWAAYGGFIRVLDNTNISMSYAVNTPKLSYKANLIAKRMHTFLA